MTSAFWNNVSLRPYSKTVTSFYTSTYSTSVISAPLSKHDVSFHAYSMSSTYLSPILTVKCYLASILYNWRLFHGYKMTHCKKRLAVFPSFAAVSPTKLSLAGYKLIITGQGRVWLVTSRLGTGKSLTFFTVYQPPSFVTVRRQPPSLENETSLHQWR